MTTDNTPPNNVLSSFLKRNGGGDFFQEGAWRVPALATGQLGGGGSLGHAPFAESQLPSLSHCSASTQCPSSSSCTPAPTHLPPNTPPHAPPEPPNHQELRLWLSHSWHSQERSESACKANAVSLSASVEPGTCLFWDRNGDVCQIPATQTSHSISTCPGCPWHPSTPWFRFVPWLLLTATKDVSHHEQASRLAASKAQCPSLGLGSCFFLI